MRRAEPLAGLGGVLLLVSLFLDWYSVGVSTPGIVSITLERGSGWQFFAVIDVLLALMAVLAIAVPLVSAFARGPARPVAVAVIASTVTPLAVLLVAFRMLFPPDVDGLGVEVSLTPGLGAWLSLAGALLAVVGAWLSLRDESTPGAAPPEVPRRAAPPARAA